MSGQPKRFKWTAERMLTCLRYLIDHHAEFTTAKRRGTLDVFFEQTGAATAADLNIDKTVIENLLKNLAKEFRAVVKERMTSGEETDDMHPHPLLRESEELFQVFDEYYTLYHKKGGAARPEIVVTAGLVVRPADFTKTKPTQPAARSTPPASLDLSQESISMPDLSKYTLDDQSDDDLQLPSTSSITKSPPKKRAKNAEFLDSSLDFQQQHIRLLQQQNRILTQQNENMADQNKNTQLLVVELRLIRHLLAMKHGVQFEGVGDEEMTSALD